MGGRATATRLYVGGLGERVTEEDLRKTFSNLGSIEAVDIIRTKGRSFAYINFLPSSENSIAKLFSMYNGCSWKGGKLRLEKAKEHYGDRLKREWGEAAEVENTAHISHTEVDENMVASADPKSTLDLEKAQIRIFFPKFRKVKSLPLRGTGKHKYSFQRVEVPSLPVHICDCCLEHSDPVQTPGEKVHNADIKDAGINEEESNVINSVMNGRLNGETSSKSEPSRILRETEAQDSETQDGGMNEEEIKLMDLVMKNLFNRGSASKPEKKGPQDHPQQSTLISNVLVDMNEIDDGTDDDDIKINTASGHDDALFLESWGLQTNLVNETARSNKQLIFDGLATQSRQATRENKVKSSNKKRKTPSDESNKKDSASPMAKKKVRLQTQSKKSKELVENLNSETEPGPKKSSRKDMWSQKSSWKELVGDGTSSSFSMSHVPGGEPKNEDRPNTGNNKSSDGEEHTSDNNVLHEKVDGQPALPKDRDEPPTVQPPKPSTGADKSTRGSLWLQKSSWTQLVGGQSSSSFSISQILPTNMIQNQKQDKHKPNTLSTTVKVPRTNGTALDGSRGSKPTFTASNKKKDAHVSTSRDTEPRKAPSDDHLSDKTTEKRYTSEPKQKSNSIPGIGLGVGVSKTCPFMRSADSSKWHPQEKK